MDVIVQQSMHDSPGQQHPHQSHKCIQTDKACLRSSPVAATDFEQTLMF